eukprot:1623545-Prymnesium_polylepis.1
MTCEIVPLKPNEETPPQPEMVGASSSTWLVCVGTASTKERCGAQDASGGRLAASAKPGVNGRQVPKGPRIAGRVRRMQSAPRAKWQSPRMR